MTRIALSGIEIEAIGSKPYEVLLVLGSMSGLFAQLDVDWCFA